jgi:hypothetical protein
LALFVFCLPFHLFSHLFLAAFHLSSLVYWQKAKVFSPAWHTHLPLGVYGWIVCLFIYFGWVCVNMVYDDINSARSEKRRQNKESQLVTIISVSRGRDSAVSSCVPKGIIFSYLRALSSFNWLCCLFL